MWRVDLSPFEVFNAERRAGTSLRRKAVARGIRLSPNCIAARNDGRKRAASERVKARLLAALQGART